MLNFLLLIAFLVLYVAPGIACLLMIYAQSLRVQWTGFAILGCAAFGVGASVPILNIIEAFLIAYYQDNRNLVIWSNQRVTERNAEHQESKDSQEW